MTSLFSPLATSFLGFDRFFNEIDYMLAADKTSMGFPPLNLYKEADGGYSIELALAGFKKTDIKIEHDRKRGHLTVSGEQTPKVLKLDGDSKTISLKTPDREVLKQGIAARKFVRAFTIADNLEIKEANLEDGLLTITLRQIEREEDKPLLIPLT